MQFFEVKYLQVGNRVFLDEQKVYMQITNVQLTPEKVKLTLAHDDTVILKTYDRAHRLMVHKEDVATVNTYKQAQRAKLREKLPRRVIITDTHWAKARPFQGSKLITGLIQLELGLFIAAILSLIILAMTNDDSLYLLLILVLSLGELLVMAALIALRIFVFNKELENEVLLAAREKE